MSGVEKAVMEKKRMSWGRPPGNANIASLQLKDVVFLCMQ